MRCALALDGVDDGERCICEGWYGDARVESTSPHVRIRTCEVAF